jgi:hypothetical protein
MRGVTLGEVRATQVWPMDDEQSRGIATLWCVDRSNPQRRCVAVSHACIARRLVVTGTTR